MPVLGIGGIFFRAQDPEALSAWYREHLGVGAGCVAPDTGPADEWSWRVQGGPVVFSPFEAGTDYWAADKQYMLNLRVSDLAGLLDQLKASGITVIVKPEWDATPEIGRVCPHPRPGRQRHRTVGTAGVAVTQRNPRSNMSPTPATLTGVSREPLPDRIFQAPARAGCLPSAG